MRNERHELNVETYLESISQNLDTLREETETAGGNWIALFRWLESESFTLALLRVGEVILLGLILWRVW